MSDTGDITAGWLAERLQEGGAVAGADVRALTVSEIQQGMTGRVLRIEAEYRPPSAGPAKLIAKLPGRNPGISELVRRFRLYEREAGFYRDLAHRAGVPVPRCYFAGPVGEEHAILLEDLTPAIAGDLAAGCDPGVADSVLRHLAAMHSRWWGAGELTSVGWLPTPRGLVDPASAAAAYASAWDRFAARHGDRLPEGLVRLGERLRGNRTVLDSLSEPPLTLVHGDCRLNNLLFDPSGGAVVAFIDWQVAVKGKPASDAACLLVSSLNPDIRREAQEELLRSYHSALVAHGVTGYSLDRCQLEFRLEILSEVIQTIVWANLDLGTEGETGPEGEVAAARLFAAIDDLDLLDLVPAPPAGPPGRSSMVRAMELNLAGFRVGVTTTPKRAESISQNPLYRRLVKPAIDRLGHRDEGPAPPPPPAEPRPDLSDPQAAAVWEEVSRLGWYHTIDVGHGIATPGFVDNRSTVDRFGLPRDMSGMRGLDIGTYDGFWSFEMERRGASEMIGIDLDDPLDHDLPRLTKKRLLEESQTAEGVRRTVGTQLAQVGMQLPGEGFRLAKRLLGSKAERRVLDVYQVSPEALGGTFDVVLISQLLLRLRDPQTVIENMFSVTRGFAIVAEPYDAELERMDRPVSEFVGTEKLGAWWSHSIKSMRKMMEVAGFDPVEEVARFPVTNKVGSFTKVILKGHAPTKS